MLLSSSQDPHYQRICHYIPYACLVLVLVTFRSFSVLLTSKSEPPKEFHRQHKPSPYEQRWPEWQLPDYALKRDVYPPPPANRSVCFIHVGKTAGSTVGCSLGFQLHCGRHHEYHRDHWYDILPTKEYYYDAPEAPGLLPRYTPNTFHKSVNDCPAQVAYFLVVLRNPVTRAQSAYAYDRVTEWKDDYEHAGELYIGCNFTTLNKLTEEGLAPHGKANETCRQIANDAIRGVNLRYGDHLWFNYAYYANETIDVTNDTKVVVTRTEYLVDDWNSIEALLGGHDRIDEFPHQNTLNKVLENWHAKAFDNDKYLSEEAQRYLCQALCDEIQVYKRFLKLAVNINVTQLNDSMENLREYCPAEADAEECAMR